MLNLPGLSSFDPTRPRLMKWDSLHKWVSCDLVVFIDDLRGTVSTGELEWKLSRTVVSRIQYLGIQEASHRRRPPTCTPRAWAGGVVSTSSTNIRCSVSQEKWDKAKRLIKAFWDGIKVAKADVDSNSLIEVELHYKDLEITKGFLVHLSMTFDWLTHHLKGLHLSLADHLPGRDNEGWKLTEVELLSYLSFKVEKGLMTQEEVNDLIKQEDSKVVTPVPKTVKLTQHLRDDLFALKEFFELPVPQQIRARRQSVHLLLYGFADALLYNVLRIRQ
jgi:hypothetical protein